MKENNAKLWMGLFLGIILIIPISYMILKPHINTENYENRELAKFPEFSVANFQNIPKGIDDFVADNFPYKNQMVLFNSIVNERVFNDNPTANTIKGNDGFIFYTGETGNSLAQYKGTLQLSEDDLATISDNLKASKKYLEEKNCRFVLMICPNKERFYSEYMPKNIKVYSDISNTTQIIDYLNNDGEIDVLWAYEPLLEYKNNNPDKPIYFHLDTHWNDLGAFIGTKALCDVLGVEIKVPEFEKTDYSTYDLANYSGLRLVLDGTDVDYEPVNYVNDYEIEEDDVVGNFIYHNSGKNDLRLMMCRDSFAISMRRYLGNTFNECNLIHRNIFENEKVDEFKPDIFVYEVCERDINRLLDFRLE